MRLVRTLLVFGLLGLAGWQGAVLYRAAVAANHRPPVVRTAKAGRGELRLTLSGYGTLEAAKTFTVHNEQVDASIVEVAEDGALVTKGQVVVKLDRTKIEKELRDRKLAYEDAKGQLKKVEADSLLNVNQSATKMTKAQQEQALLLASNRADLAQAQAKVKFDESELTYRERDLDRTKRLAKDLLVPAVNIDRADLSFKSKQLELTQGERNVDVKQHEQRSALVQGQLLISDAKYSAESAKYKAQETVENQTFNAAAAGRLFALSERQLRWCEVRAPAAGLTVLARDWDPSTGGQRPLRPGDPARPMQRFMDIIDLSKMRVVAEMSEMDASQIKAGQLARVWPRSAPDLVLKARVVSISSLARQAMIWRRGAIPGKKTFRVLIEVLESRPDLLRPGMTADFEVLQSQVTTTVRVPLQALFKTSQGTTVFVKKGRHFEARPVKLGPRNANYAAIASGLKGGEEIALQRPSLELLHEPVTRDTKQAGLLRRAFGVLF